MLIYVLMCLIASRKPGGRIVLAFFLVWMCVVAACSILAVRGNIPRRMLHRRAKIERIMQTEVVLDGDSTTVGNLLRDHERVESVLNTEEHTLRISVPDRHIDISVDKNNASVTVTEEEDDD